LVWHRGTQVVVLAPGSTLQTRGEVHVTPAHDAGGDASPKPMDPLETPELVEVDPPELVEADPPELAEPLAATSPLDEEPPPASTCVQLPAPCSWLSSVAQPSTFPTATTSRQRDADAPDSVSQHAASAEHPEPASAVLASLEAVCEMLPLQAPRAAATKAIVPPHRIVSILPRIHDRQSPQD